MSANYFGATYHQWLTKKYSSSHQHQFYQSIINHWPLPVYLLDAFWTFGYFLMSRMTLIPIIIISTFICNKAIKSKLTLLLFYTWCRFPCLLLWFFVMSWACAIHMPLCHSLVLSLCVLNACLFLNPPFHYSKLGISHGCVVKKGNTLMLCGCVKSLHREK